MQDHSAPLIYKASSEILFHLMIAAAVAIYGIFMLAPLISWQEPDPTLSLIVAMMVGLLILVAVVLRIRIPRLRHKLQLSPEGITYGEFRAQTGVDFVPWSAIATCWQHERYVLLSLKPGPFLDSLTPGSWMKVDGYLRIETFLLQGGTLKIYSDISDGIYGRLFASQAQS